MYPDTKHIRHNRLTLRFDDYEHDLIQALANYQGKQPSTLLRQLVLREVADALGIGDSDIVIGKAA